MGRSAHILRGRAGEVVLNQTRVRGPRASSAAGGFAGVVLAGGRNSRMGGCDKAFLRVGGETVIARTLAVLWQCCDQVVVVTNTPEKYSGFDVEVTSDQYALRGPLAGIHAGLARVSTPHAFVVACDMPFLRIEPILYLHRFVGDGDAVVPWWDGDVEPLHAFYSTRVRAPIGQILERGSGAVRDLLREIHVRYVPEAEMRTVAGAEEAFRNVNTPEEAARYSIRV